MLGLSHLHTKHYWKNKIPQAISCGATHVASVHFTSKLVFCIHIIGVKKYHQNNQSSNMHKKLEIVSSCLKAFCCFLFIEKYLILKFIKMWA